MYRRGQYRHPRRRKSPPRHLKRSKSPPHYLRKDSLPHFSRRIEPSSGYVGKRESPFRYVKRSPPSPNLRTSQYLEDSYLNFSERMEPLSSNLRSNSPPPFFHRSWSPHYYSRRPESPPYSPRRTESPSYYLEGSDSPAQYHRRSRSHSPSPNPNILKFEPPPQYLEDPSPDYSRRIDSPSGGLKRSNSLGFLHRSGSPHQFSRKSESSLPYLRSNFHSSSPDARTVGFDSPSYYLERSEFPPRYLDTERENDQYYDLQRDLSEKHQFAMSTSRNLLMYPTDFTNETPDINWRDQPASTSMTSRKPLKRIRPRVRQKTSAWVKSLEEIDKLSDQKLQRIRVSGASRKKVKFLVENGSTYEEAKRTVIKQNFIRTLNKQLELKSRQAGMSHRTSKGNVTQLTNETLEPDIKNPLSGPSRLKRAISETSTSHRPEHKKPKIGDNSKIVVIAHAAYPEILLVPKKLTLTQNAIVKAYESLVTSEIQVRIENYQHRPGYLLVTCADKTSEDWLKKIVPELKPWNGAKLKTLSEDSISKPVKCHVYIPDHNGNRLAPKTILSKLHRFNKGLNSHLWTALGNTPLEKGRVWFFAIDTESFEILKKLNMRPSIGFTTLKFKQKKDI